jgi:hypothetical protein
VLGGAFAVLGRAVAVVIGRIQKENRNIELLAKILIPFDDSIAGVAAAQDHVRHRQVDRVVHMAHFNIAEIVSRI